MKIMLFSFSEIMSEKIFKKMFCSKKKWLVIAPWYINIIHFMINSALKKYLKKKHIYIIHKINIPSYTSPSPNIKTFAVFLYFSFALKYFILSSKKFFIMWIRVQKWAQAIKNIFQLQNLWLIQYSSIKLFHIKINIFGAYDDMLKDGVMTAIPEAYFFA